MFQALAKRLRRTNSRSHRGNGQRQRGFRVHQVGMESLELRQMLTGYSVSLASHAVASPDTAANGNSYQEIVSQDGRYVVFGSDATNIVSGMQFTPKRVYVGSDEGDGTIPVNIFNSYRLDRLTGEIKLVSINSAGTGGGNDDSGYAFGISADG